MYYTMNRNLKNNLNQLICVINGLKERYVFTNNFFAQYTFEFKNFNVIIFAKLNNFIDSNITWNYSKYFIFIFNILKIAISFKLFINQLHFNYITFCDIYT